MTNLRNKKQAKNRICKGAGVYITTPTKKEAEKIAQVLVKERLAACVNFFPIESVYHWKGKIGNEFLFQNFSNSEIKKVKEVGMFVKTKAKLVEKIIKRVKELHSYEVPCIISLPIEKGEQKFLKWLEEETK